MSMGVRGRLHDEEGATATLVILGIAALLGAALVAIDAGSILHTRRGLIADTDAAALGTAIELLDDRCATEADALAEATLIAQTNDPETNVSDITLDRGGNCTSGFGTVQVSTENPAALFFAPLFGIDQWSPAARSTAVYGRVRAMEGLRPIGICAADQHYSDWAALQGVLRDGNTSNDAAAQAAYDARRGNPAADYPIYAGAGVVHRVPFERIDGGGGACGSAAGNWGWQDYDGGSNSNRDLVDWIRNGYPGVVDLGGPASGDEDCVEGEAGFDDCDAATGGRGKSTEDALDSITCPAGLAATDDACTVIYILVYDVVGDTSDTGDTSGNDGNSSSGNGANAEYHPVSFLGLVIRGHDLGTGQEFGTDSWIDLEFVDELVEGPLGPALPNDPFPGPRGVQMCASEYFTNCPDP